MGGILLGKGLILLTSPFLGRVCADSAGELDLLSPLFARSLILSIVMCSKWVRLRQQEDQAVDMRKLQDGSSRLGTSDESFESIANQRLSLSALRRYGLGAKSSQPPA